MTSSHGSRFQRKNWIRRGNKQPQQVCQINLLIENNRREGQVTKVVPASHRFEKIEIGEVEPNFEGISKLTTVFKNSSKPKV